MTVRSLQPAAGDQNLHVTQILSKGLAKAWKNCKRNIELQGHETCYEIVNNETWTPVFSLGKHFVTDRHICTSFNAFPMQLGKVDKFSSSI